MDYLRGNVASSSVSPGIALWRLRWTTVLTAACDGGKAVRDSIRDEAMAASGVLHGELLQYQPRRGPSLQVQRWDGSGHSSYFDCFEHGPHFHS
jgi:hypothetical protein